MKAVKSFPALKKSKVFQTIFRQEIENKSKNKRSVSNDKSARKSYKNQTKEEFSSLKEYISSLSDVILESDSFGSSVIDKDYTIQQLTSQLRQKELEIKDLKLKFGISKQVRGQFTTQNSPEPLDSLFNTPKIQKTNGSSESLASLSVDSMFKSKRSGQVLTSLLSKLRPKSPMTPK